MMFNESKLLEHFESDKEMIFELTNTLDETYPVVLESLKSGIEQKKYTEVELHAHTLKGMLLNFFCEDLSDMALRLEKQGREKDTLDGALELYDNLEKSIPELVKELRGYCD